MTTETVPSLFFNRTAVAGFEQLVSKFDNRAFASPFRSTIPLLAMVKHDWGRLRSALAACDLSAEGTLHFEYQVASPKGGGTPSHTDLMVLSSTVAVAIEAKWTEPRYETVKKRLSRKRRPDEEDPREFVEGWLDLLRPHSTKPLVLDHFSEAVYQTVHRAASACSTTRLPSVVYLHFHAATLRSQKKKASYHDDLAYLHGLLGLPERFPFHLIDVPMIPTPAFASIADLKKGLRTTNDAVRRALLSSNLFVFEEPQVRSFGVHRGVR